MLGRQAPRVPGGPEECGSSVLTSVSTTTGTRLPRKPGGARKISVENRTARRRIRRRTSLEGSSPDVNPQQPLVSSLETGEGKAQRVLPPQSPFPSPAPPAISTRPTSVPSLPCQPQLHLPLSVVLPDSRGARHSRGDAIGDADTECANVISHHAVRHICAALVCCPYPAQVRGGPATLESRRGDMALPCPTWPGWDALHHP